MGGARRSICATRTVTAWNSTGIARRRSGRALRRESLRCLRAGSIWRIYWGKRTRKCRYALPTLPRAIC